MKNYLAPMEGITNYVYRNAYNKYFEKLDKYFTPFIIPNKNQKLKTKELRDILPENNGNLNVVPQILTNNAQLFINTSTKLEKLGYTEVNLNLGCPSKTVVSKNKGSGFLAIPDQLDKFLEEIFNNLNMKISIKTRLGLDDSNEFFKILDIYNKYNLEELIIHPRTQKDFYGNTPNMEMFKYSLENSKAKVSYNGDIFNVEIYNKLVKSFPTLDSIMLGRGVIANPNLISELKGHPIITKENFWNFHKEIFEEYRKTFKDDKNAMFRMKELWGYMGGIFSNNKKYLKKIKKSQNANNYYEIILNLLDEQEIIKGNSIFCK